MKIRHPRKVEERTSWILVEKKKKRRKKKCIFVCEYYHLVTKVSKLSDKSVFIVYQEKFEKFLSKYLIENVIKGHFM